MQLNKRITIFILGFSGGIIYFLPYYSKYLFYDFMREFFNLSHSEFGELQGVYGLTGVLFYYLGGKIADKFSIKYILFISMFFSGILGFSMLLINSFQFLVIIFILFSVTTNIGFWASSLKLIMNLGNVYEQGRILGFFEGSKGIGGVVFGILSFIFLKKNISFEIIILLYSFIIIFCSIVTLFTIKDSKIAAKRNRNKTSFIKPVKDKKIFLISFIMLFYYIIYSNLVYMNLYLEDIFLFTPQILMLSAFFRIYFLKIFISPLSGYIIDKEGSTIRVFTINFFLLLVFQSLLLYTPRNRETGIFIFINIILITILSIVFVSVKFSLLTELKADNRNLGEIIGFISTIVYFPDIFSSKLIGEVLDRYGNASYKYIFFIGILCSIGGLLICFYFHFQKNIKKLS